MQGVQPRKGREKIIYYCRFRGSFPRENAFIYLLEEKAKSSQEMDRKSCRVMRSFIFCVFFWEAFERNSSREIIRSIFLLCCDALVTHDLAKKQSSCVTPNFAVVLFNSQFASFFAHSKTSLISLSTLLSGRHEGAFVMMKNLLRKHDLKASSCCETHESANAQ